MTNYLNAPNIPFAYHKWRLNIPLTKKEDLDLTKYCIEWKKYIEKRDNNKNNL